MDDRDRDDGDNSLILNTRASNYVSRFLILNHVLSFCCRGSFPYFYGLLSTFHIINESSTLESLHIIDGLRRLTDLDVLAELLVEFDIFLGIFRKFFADLTTSYLLTSPLFSFYLLSFFFLYLLLLFDPIISPSYSDLISCPLSIVVSFFFSQGVVDSEDLPLISTDCSVHSILLMNHRPWRAHDLISENMKHNLKHE